MRAIHWGGGVRTGRLTALKGWPCCCSGAHAESIKSQGAMVYKLPQEVTCKKCRALLGKVGMLSNEEMSDD